MPDSSLIDNALVAKLGGDATLLAICANGVYWDQSPPGSKRFVIVSLIDETDEAQFGVRAYEDGLYLVKAVALSTEGADMAAAAARIDALLEDQTLTVSGYTHMVMHRESRVRITEVDDEDHSIRWFHRGGMYRIQQAVA